MTFIKRPYRVFSNARLLDAMERVAVTGGTLQPRYERSEAVDFLEKKALAEGPAKPIDHSSTCQTWIEEEAISRAIELAGLVARPLYVVHLSTAGGLARIVEAQARGHPVWTETCPQCLLLDDGEFEELGPLAKTTPPVRMAGTTSS